MNRDKSERQFVQLFVCIWKEDEETVLLCTLPGDLANAHIFNV